MADWAGLFGVGCSALLGGKPTPWGTGKGARRHLLRAPQVSKKSSDPVGRHRERHLDQVQPAGGRTQEPLEADHAHRGNTAQTLRALWENLGNG